MTEFDDDANQQIYNDLFFSAMRRYKERQQCEACTGNHPVDECRARGWHFLDPVTQKRVQQVNARLGDKPINPPKPPTPPKATFNSSLKQKSMIIKLSGQQPEDLQYRTISSTAEVETVLNEITQDMESAIDKDELIVNPKLAVINYDPHKVDDPSSGRNLADAVQVADYSVYNEQVNC
jgi:hypothetical protein